MSYENYKQQMTRIADIQFASALLQWDQEVYMPAAGADQRANQLATLSSIAHEMSTGEQLGKWLNELKSVQELSAEQKANVKHSLRDYTNRKKYSAAFVEKMSLQVSKTFNAWQEAKAQSNFTLYAKELDQLIELKLREADLLGYKDHPYDALLDQYEPDLTVKELDVLFAQVRSELVPFVKELFGKKVKSEFMYANYPSDKQWDLGITLLKDMGYDFESGRQDISSHPFTINFGSKDVRVTTRINENDFHEMIWSCIHEGGHALYEQGLKPENYGLPMGEAVSLSIHESQSRFWENNVGRSKPYWTYYYPYIQELFPQQLKNVSLHEFYCAMNEVKPSLIRTNADELTYHFHVMVRYEIEKMILEKKVKTNELPDLWNEKYKAYLGIDVPNDAQGVLQDVHWSHGSFGYFPTYSLGSFYAAQFYAALKKQIPNLEMHIEKGEFAPILAWLRENIHQYGKLYSAKELSVRISGEPLNFSYFMSYAKDKYTKMFA